jgi:peptide/nickel transport system permease protein
MIQQRSIVRTLLKAMGAELVRGLLVAILSSGILGSILWLGGDPIESFGDGPWWLTDADGLSLLETFPSQALKTSSLVLSALAMTFPLALLISILVCLRPSLKPLRFLVLTVSGAPVFVLAYVFVGASSPFFLAAATLAIADLSLGGTIAMIEPVLTRELKSDHARAARAKGASLRVHLWRPVLVTLLLSLRTRLPVLFAATVVAERIFNIPGLGDQAAFSVLERSDPVFLIWFGLFTVLVTRLCLVFGRSLEAALIPQDQQTAFVHSGLGSFLSSLFHRSSRPLVTVDTTLSSVQIRPLSVRRRRSFERFLDAFAFRSPTWTTRLSAFLLILPVWLLAGSVLVGALFVDADGLYGDARQLGAFQWNHWLGTDELERDVLVQILLGARYALPYWLLAVFIPIVLGLLFGTLSVLRSLQGPLELVMESLDALPKLIVVLVTVAVFGLDRYVEVAYPIMGLVFAPFVYAHVRSRVWQLIRTRFVEAEQVAGASALRTLLVHVVWSNLRGVILSCAAYVFGAVVLLDATCGYLQVAQRELCAWGALVFDNVQAWNQWYGLDVPFNIWGVLAPMLTATAMILAGTYLGDGLSAAFSHEER